MNAAKFLLLGTLCYSTFSMLAAETPAVAENKPAPVITPAPAPSPAAAPDKPKYVPNQVSVLSPAYNAEISGTTKIEFIAPGLTEAEVKCWKQGEGFGSDSTVATLKLDEEGKGAFDFPANEYPRGPICVRILAKGEKLKDNCYLVLYNKSGVSWMEGIPKDAPPAAAGLTLVYADDFDKPLSISTKDPKATYFDHKPGGGDFSKHAFSGHESPKDPFKQVDTYLRIRASDKLKSSGLISSTKNDGTGIKTPIPCYFECRFIAPNAVGSWPAFWVMTDYMTGRLAKTETHGPDELDIIEGYGGEGPKSPNSKGEYMIASHFWNQGEAGKKQKGVYKPVKMQEFAGKSGWWVTPHIYGLKMDETDTIYYCDNVEVGRHPTGAVSKKFPIFFMINLATGGGWPIDLSRYNGEIDMYVDYVRVYGPAPKDPARETPAEPVKNEKDAK